MDVDAAPAAAASPEAVAEAADKDWQRLAAGLNLKNVAMLPAALHIRGHLTTAVLQHKAHLRNFFCPLFSERLVYAKSKWRAVSKECAAKAAAARLGAHDALDAADGDGAEAAREIEEHAATLEEVAAVQAELDEDSDVACLLETDTVDQPHIAGLDPKEAAADLVAAVEADAAAAKRAAAQRFAQKSDVQALKMEALREQLELRGQDTEGKKNDLVERLWSFDDEAWRDKGEDDTTKVKLSLGRGTQLFYFIMLLWIGKEEDWPSGRSLRQRVVDMFMEVGGPVHTYWKEKHKSTDLPEWTERVAIGQACEKSSYILGLWRLIDTEIRVAVVPFERWMDGDVQSFCSNIGLMTLQIVAAGMPTISRFMVLQTQRMLYWAKHRPDVIRTLALNAKRCDDRHVENLNACQGRLAPQRHRPTMETYKHTSCLIKGSHALSKMLDAAALSGRQRGSSRASQNAEHVRLRGIYATATWVPSLDQTEEWIFNLFEAGARGDAALDANFPGSDRIEAAKAKLARVVKLLENWLENQRLTPVYVDE